MIKDEIFFYKLKMIPYHLIFNFWVNLKNFFFIFRNSFFLFFIKEKNYFYKSYDNERSYTNFWYESRIYNIIKYGRSGSTDYLGGKKYKNSRFWFYNIPIIKFYNNSGCLTVFLSCICWIFFSFLYLYPVFSLDKLLFIIISILTSEFSRQFFKYQNYNALGWALFPLTIYLLSNDYFYLFFLSTIILAYCSLSVFFLTIFVLTYLILIDYKFFYFLPILIGISIYFFNLIAGVNNFKDIFKNLLSVAKSIGLVKINNISMKEFKKLTLNDMQFFLLNVQFVVIFYYFNSIIPIITIISLLLYYINRFNFRFADDQNTEFFIFNSMFAQLMLKDNIYLVEIFSFWLSYSYYFFLPNLYPINMKKTYNIFLKFSKAIPKNKIVMMNFKKYKNFNTIFDNQREMINIINFIGTKKNVLFFPDFNTMFENSFNTFNFWGQNYKDLKKKIKIFNVDYFLHTNLNNILKKKFKKDKNFTLKKEFNWQYLYEDKKIVIPTNYFRINKKKLPNWGLIKINK